MIVAAWLFTLGAIVAWMGMQVEGVSAWRWRSMADDAEQNAALSRSADREDDAAVYERSVARRRRWAMRCSFRWKLWRVVMLACLGLAVVALVRSWIGGVA